MQPFKADHTVAREPAGCASRKRRGLPHSNHTSKQLKSYQMMPIF